VVRYISVNQLVGLLTKGLKCFPSGRAGEPASLKLSESLKQAGFKLGRLKTGTPARLAKRSIDFRTLTIQKGDDPPLPFSFMHERPDIQVRLTSFIPLLTVIRIK